MIYILQSKEQNDMGWWRMIISLISQLGFLLNNKKIWTVIVFRWSLFKSSRRSIFIKHTYIHLQLIIVLKNIPKKKSHLFLVKVSRGRLNASDHLHLSARNKNVQPLIHNWTINNYSINWKQQVKYFVLLL